MRLKCHLLQSPVSENGTQRGQLTRGGRTAPAGEGGFVGPKDVLVQGEFQTAFSFPPFLLKHSAALLPFHSKSWVENIYAGACGLLCFCPKSSWVSWGACKGFLPLCRVYSLQGLCPASASFSPPLPFWTPTSPPWSPRADQAPCLASALRDALGQRKSSAPAALWIQ